MLLGTSYRLLWVGRVIEVAHRPCSLLSHFFLVVFREQQLPCVGEETGAQEEKRLLKEGREGSVACLLPPHLPIYCNAWPVSAEVASVE